MHVKEIHVSKGASPFIMKLGVSPIPSSITKVGVPPFIINMGASPLLVYRETSVRMTRLCFASPL
jgi:hypothetical protein